MCLRCSTFYASHRSLLLVPIHAPSRESPSRESLKLLLQHYAFGRRNSQLFFLRPS
jgi:hypothetical protein